MICNQDLGSREKAEILKSEASFRYSVFWWSDVIAVREPHMQVIIVHER